MITSIGCSGKVGEESGDFNQVESIYLNLET
jgi:hypothetical protein